MKKHVKKIIVMMSVCALALCMAALTACGPEPAPDPDPDPAPVVTVTLDKTTGSLAAGDTLVLTATVTNSTAAPTFVSSNTAVATVSGSGKTATVTGVAAGTATITAAVGDKTATCALTVTAKTVEQKLTLDKEYVILENGGETFKEATVTAVIEGEGTALFASADEDVATVTAAGNIATVIPHKTGVTTLTATFGGTTAECTVEVASYGLDYQLMELDLDEETTVTAFRVLDSKKDLTGDIRIPAQYWSDEEEGYFPVVEVAKEGFKGNTGITSVFLGDELLTVGQDAFKECEALTTVTTGAKLNSIGAAAFNSCAALATFNWAEDCVTSSIGAGAFGWSGIREIVIPSTATGFNWGMFQCADKLERVYIYAPITQIYNDTFLKCDSLAEIWLPATLTTISPGAFGGYAGFPDDGPGSKGSFKIHFAGTEEQWQAITVEEGNNGAILKSKNKNLTIVYDVKY